MLWLLFLVGCVVPVCDGVFESDADVLAAQSCADLPIIQVSGESTITELALPNVQTLTGDVLLNGELVTTVSLPRLSAMGPGFTGRGPNVAIIEAPLVTSLGRLSLESQRIQRLDFAALEEVSGEIYLRSAPQRFTLPALNHTGTLTLLDAFGVQDVFLPALEMTERMVISGTVRRIELPAFDGGGQVLLSGNWLEHVAMPATTGAPFIRIGNIEQNTGLLTVLLGPESEPSLCLVRNETATLHVEGPSILTGLAMRALTLNHVDLPGVERIETFSYVAMAGFSTEEINAIAAISDVVDFLGDSDCQ